MKLYVITGTCGAGKSTVLKKLEKRLDPARFICLDTDSVGLNWNDYAGTDHEYKYSDDCLAAAVRLSDGKDIVFASCLNPEDYIGKHTTPTEIDSTYFIVLSAEDTLIEERLKARPVERGFTSDEIIKPHIEYNRWFRKNRSKFNMFIDTTDISVDSVAGRIAGFISAVSTVEKQS